MHCEVRKHNQNTIMSDKDFSKIVFTFEFSKDNLSKWELSKREYSRKYSVADVVWQVYMERAVASDPKKNCLRLFLSVEGVTKLWCCYIRTRITILSQKENSTNFSKNYERLFSTTSSSWGFSEFIDWDQLTNPNSGFIKNDSVNFQVHIEADPPQNVDPNYTKDTAVPVKYEDWLAVFENRINEQIVCRLSEEFKKIVSTVDEGFKNANRKNDDIKKDTNAVQIEIVKVKRDIDTVKEGLDSVKQNLDSVKQDIGTVKQDFGTVKQDFSTINEDVKQDLVAVKEDISVLKDGVTNVYSAIDEMKNLLLERDETCDEENSCEEKNKSQEDTETDSHKTDCVNEDFVVRKLNEFKNEIMRELFLHRSPESQISYSIPPWFGYNEPFPRTNYGRGFNEGSDHHLWGKYNSPRESVAHDRFGCAAQDKGARNGHRCSISSSSTTHQLHEIENFLENCDGNETGSTDSPHSDFVQEPIKSNSSIPSEEEALLQKMDLDKPWPKELLLIGKDGDGKPEIHRASSLKELFDLKKQFKECEVFESEKTRVQA